MPTRSRQVLDQIAARLSTIAVADGFVTDAGSVVIIGSDSEVIDLSDDLPAGFIVVGSGEVYRATGSGDGLADGKSASMSVAQTIFIKGMIKADDPATAGENLLGDAKKALCLQTPLVDLDGRPMGMIGLEGTNKNPRAAGFDFDGFIITARTTHIEAWGDPFSIR